MTLKVAVAFYPEGMGHATRMLGVGREIETRGCDVIFAGSGPGTHFVRQLGYDVYEPTSVEFIRDYQYSPPINVLLRSVPCGAKRTMEFVRWLRREDPDVLVTDDMFAAMAAELAQTPFYIVSHNSSSLYDAVVDVVLTRFINRYQQTFGKAFFYPAVWPPLDGDPDSTRVSRIPPVALEAPENAPDPDRVDVLLVPSTYSDGFATVADRLTEAGRKVTLVGGDDWDPVPALLPWLRAANLVVCSGYSTIMEAAVAGTPCVVWPFTDEQYGVARKLSQPPLRGFTVCYSGSDIVRAVEHPPQRPVYENGTAFVAKAVVEKS